MVELGHQQFDGALPELLGWDGDRRERDRRALGQLVGAHGDDGQVVGDPPSEPDERIEQRLYNWLVVYDHCGEVGVLVEQPLRDAPRRVG